MGGTDGTNDSNEVYRAELLNPLDAPIVSIDVNITDFNTAFPPGLYQYRVSAIFALADTRNPGGESLPSPIISIIVPNLKNFSVVLSWIPIPNAIGYRIYRTLTPYSSSSTIQLIKEIGNVNIFSDTGLGALNATFPLIEGNIGKWLKITSMNKTRAGHRSLAVKSNSSSDIWYIYAFSGLTQSSYEFLTIDASKTPHTIIQTWSLQPWPSAGSPRAYFGAWKVSRDDSTSIPVNQSWVYIIGGKIGNTPTTITLAGQVTNNGIITFSPSSDNLKAAAYGFCGIQAAGVGYRIGGNDLPETNAYEAAHQNTPPAIAGANSFNGSPAYILSQGRRYMDCISESAVMFVVGGYNGTKATGLVDYSVQ
jgi:hypothetical protein